MPGYYNIDGEIYPSVTTILGKMLPEPYGIKIWKIRNPNWQEELKYKATMGSIIHYRILSKLSTRILELPNITIDDIPYEVQHIFEIADTIWDDFKFDIGHPRTIETIHVDRKEKVVGSPDLIAPFDDVRTIADIKTSKAIHDTHELQIGGYYNMLKNNGIPEDKLPEQGVLISVHPYEEGNPNFKGHCKVLTKEKLEEKACKFVSLTRKYHRVFSVKKRGNVTRYLVNPPKHRVESIDEDDLEIERVLDE
jgi:hypothetical protein